jgi:hypothetical protein
MPTYDGQLLNINLTITVFSVPIKVKGTVEVLGIRKKV